MKKTNNIRLKKLKPADFQLARDLFTFFQEDDGVKKTTSAGKAYLQGRLKKDDFHVIVAMDADTLAGGITAYEMTMYKAEFKEMFLYEIAVKKAYRKKGIAKKLVEELKNLCRKRGIDVMYVGTSPSNTAAMELYKTTGGKPDFDTLWITYKIV